MASTDVLHMLVSDVLQATPAAAQVFLDCRMSCVGCPFARFETVADVAATYRMDPTELATALLQAGVDPTDAREGLNP